MKLTHGNNKNSRIEKKKKSTRNNNIAIDAAKQPTLTMTKASKQTNEKKVSLMRAFSEMAFVCAFRINIRNICRHECEVVRKRSLLLKR